jgi:hypothetical protein
MPISPLGAGDGRPQEHDFTTDSALFPLNGLSGSALKLHLEDVNNSYALYICTGAYAIVGDGSAGVANFTPSSADLLSTNPLGKPGLYKAYPVVTLSTGPVAMDAQMVLVESRP